MNKIHEILRIMRSLDAHIKKKHEIHLIINNNFENRLESREAIIYFPTRCPVHCTPSLSIVAARKESVCLFVFSFTYFWTEVRQ